MNPVGNAIEIIGLSKSFGPYKAVDQLDLVVKKGDIFGFLGPNGAGKTTTLRMLAGLSKPDSGEMRLLGKAVRFGSMAGRESIGYLPDVPECYGYMKPVEFLSFCGALFGLDANAQKKRSLELLDLVGLSNVNKRIGSFSRGMKQRIGIAQALVNEPEIVFMDEPASALDPMGRFDVMEILTKLKGNTTVFFSTHIITDIERVCDTVAIIDKGKLLECGSIPDLKSKFDNQTVSIGFSSITPDEEINRFIEALKHMQWCSGVVIKKRTELLIVVTDRGMAQMALPGLVSEHRLSLSAFDSMAISLEDVFFKVVGK